MAVVCGIDYSLTSPAIVVHEGEHWDLNNCTFYFFKKKLGPKGRFIASEYPDWKQSEERYQKLTAWAMSIMQKHKVERACVEEYAFGASGSTGRLFSIGENTGLMKYGLYISGIPFTTISPGSVKRFACGKGNAKKQQMIEAFKQDTGINLYDVCEVKDGVESPTSDIADAYWICKATFHGVANAT